MPQDIEIIRPPHVRNRWHHLSGLALLAANSLRHRVAGYRTPRPQRADHADQAMHYDRAVVENWLLHLEHYMQRPCLPQDVHVLELGPGPDLGTGLLWLGLGAESYTAVDVHRLITRRNSPLHLRLARSAARWAHQRRQTREEENLPAAAELEAQLRQAVESFHREGQGPLHYEVLSDYDLTRLPEGHFDLVVSHSSLEHVGNLGRAFEQLAGAVGPRAHLVAEVDLQTHTRWIRDADPLNIYRYDRRLYRSLGFSGIPNRARPDEYLEHLERTGWCDLRLYPRRVLEPGYVAQVEPTLDPLFQGDPERLGWLSMVICASRRGDRSWGGRNA